MSDTYQDDLFYEPEPPKKRNGWTIALIVILVLSVLCCICVFVTIAGLTLMEPAIGNTFSTIIEEMVTVTPVP